MSRLVYRAGLAMAFVMATALIGAPIWDHLRYRTGSGEAVDFSRPPGRPAAAPPDGSLVGTGASQDRPDSAVTAPARGGAGSVSAPPVAKHDTHGTALVASGPAAAFRSTAEALVGTSRHADSVVPSPGRQARQAKSDSRAPTRSGIRPGSGSSENAPVRAASTAPGLFASVVPLGVAWSSPPAPPTPHDGEETSGASDDGDAEAAPGNQTPTHGTDTPTSVTLLPDRPAVSRGGTVRIKVAVAGSDPVSSLPFHLLFDPDVLEFVGVEEGPALQGASPQPILLASVNPNRPGDLAVGLALLEAAGSLTGSGSVMTLEFRALGSGQTTMAFDRASLHGPTGESLPAAFVSSEILVN